MRAHLRALLSALMSVALAAAAAPPVSAATDPPPGPPMPRAYAHNDYGNDRPLFDALEHGFTSVEVDVWLVDGRLLVGHDREALLSARTVETLYLDPLAARVRARDTGVFGGDAAPFQLVVDLKNRGAAAYSALHERLHRHRSMLSSSVAGRVRNGAVTVVVSGQRTARRPMTAQRVRYAFYDGRLRHLDASTPASVTPLVSGSWSGMFRWRGVGPMPPGERVRLREIVARAHADGQHVRFWATPDEDGHERAAVWRELVAAGVDHINTDHLGALGSFLRERQSSQAGRGDAWRRRR